MSETVGRGSPNSEDWNRELSEITAVLAKFSLEKPRVLDCHLCEQGLEVKVEIKLPKSEWEIDR